MATPARRAISDGRWLKPRLLEEGAPHLPTVGAGAGSVSAGRLGGGIWPPRLLRSVGLEPRAIRPLRRRPDARDDAPAAGRVFRGAGWCACRGHDRSYGLL